VEAVLRHAPRSLLDIGCGEGWLIRALALHVPSGLGVDAVPGLIEQAQAAGAGGFRVASYGALAQGVLNDPVDLAVSYVSLFGQSSVEQLLAAERANPPRCCSRR
jgi:hypothetical protein